MQDSTFQTPATNRHRWNMFFFCTGGLNLPRMLDKQEDAISLLCDAVSVLLGCIGRSLLQQPKVGNILT